MQPSRVRLPDAPSSVRPVGPGRSVAGGRRPRTAVLLLVAVLGALLLQGVLTTAPAAAHAVVEQTTPADGARLDAAPDRVTIRFDEQVGLGAGYARVLAPGGGRVDTGTATVEGTSVVIPLRTGLPDAGYVVTYRVVSADSHPVSGAFTFVVGDGAPVAAAAVPVDRADPAVTAALPVARGVGYLGLALGLGVPLFLLLCWPAGWTGRLLRRLTGGGLVAVAVGAVASVLLQGPDAAGTGLGSLLDPALLQDTAGSGYGVTVLLRLPLVLAAALLLLPAWRSGRAPGRGTTAAFAAVAVALVLTVAGVGHPVAGSLPGLAVAVTAVHVGAMVLWLGGLAALPGLLRRGTTTAQLRTALSRWSRLAFGAVTALVVTGVVQSLRELPAPGALVHTAYGWVLVAKVVLVALVVAVAALSRDWVQQEVARRAPRSRTARAPRRRALAAAFSGAGPDAAGTAVGPDVDPLDDGPDDEPEEEAAGPPLAVLRRWVLLEGVGAVVVLALSAVLVGLSPAGAGGMAGMGGMGHAAAAGTAARPVDVTLPLRSATSATGHGSVQLALTPARAGANTGHLAVLDAQGRPVTPQQVTATLTETARQIGPLPVPLTATGPGRYDLAPDLPTTGSWTVTVSVRLDEFTAVSAGTTFPVR